MAADLAKLVKTVLAAAGKAADGDAAEQDRALRGLTALKKERVTTKALSDTQAGKLIKPLAKHGSRDIAAAATAVIAAWKEAVRQEAGSAGAAASSGSRGGAAPAPSGPSSRQGAAEPAPSSQQTVTGADGGAAAPVPPLDPEDVPRSGDSIRDKCRQNLAGAFQLALAEGVAGDPIVCGVAVENEIFKQHGGVTQAYKAKFRNLHFNLKDSGNPDLRRKVLSGDIPPDQLLLLPPEELASDAKREENARIREKKLFDSAPGAMKQATTDQFQCGKCRQRKTTYYQMQTRSADEPMTTFVSCLNCNNRWKFC